jgi:FkbM family methyltransferase
MAYSQNNEEQYILEYFKGKEDNCFFAEIGSFHPFTFSNTRALVDLGASGIYIEPSPKCMQSFIDVYGLENEKILLIQAAITDYDGTIDFYDSVGDAISSTSIEHKEKWEAGYNVKYDKITVECVAMETLLKGLEDTQIDFLNLDVESTNIELFNLIPDWFWQRLKMICIEHDGQMDYIISKLQPFGFNELHRNGENLILAK